MVEPDITGRSPALPPDTTRRSPFDQTSRPANRAASACEGSIFCSVGNRCKHSSAGTPITIRLTQVADKVRLEIADWGAGIAPTELPHVFEPFYRSRDARNRGLPGAGLGLAVAERIATALGGMLSVESQVGAGSRFELLLPRDDSASGGPPSE